MLVSITFVVFALLGNVQGAINEFYPSYLTKEKCTGKYSWTMWFNVGKPDNETGMDNEDMAIILAQNPTTMCRKPFGIQAQSINYQSIEDYNGSPVNWKRKRLNDTISFLSFYSSESKGIDYQVRYCCPTGSFVAPTTTTTKTPITPIPMDSTTCGRRQFQPTRNRIKRLSGGETAIPNSWPWMIYYEQTVLNRLYQCGATLISKDYVLTAAHCIETAKASNITLIAGYHNTYSNMNTDRQQWRTVQTIHHPKYNSTTQSNDIAILHVDPPFILNKYVQPACLPGSEPQPNDEVIMIGWGAEKKRGAISKFLKQASTDVVDDCDRWWPGVDSSKQICVADAFGGNSACSGDSGGPLLTEYQGQYIVSGVSSYSDHDDCDTKTSRHSPNVYTRVSAYKEWIKSIIKL